MPCATAGPSSPTEIREQKPAVDRWEVQIERECVRVLALHQPVASDLRRVAAVLKINGDLERMADLARHIAKRVRKLAADPLAFPIPPGAREPRLEALTQVHDEPRRPDPGQRPPGPGGDRRRPAVDRRYRSVLKLLKQEIVRHPERINTWLRLINTARNLERIADHGFKIAEAVVYLQGRRDPPPSSRP